MKAHEFLAGHGIDEAKRVLSGAHWENIAYSNGRYYSQSCSENDVNLEELKQVVESVEFINRQGGVFSAKTQAIDIESSMKNGYKSVGLVSMKYAIADYELVESFKEKQSN